MIRYLLFFSIYALSVTSRAQNDGPVFEVKAKHVFDTLERGVEIYWIWSNPDKDGPVHQQAAWNFKRYPNGWFEYRDSSEIGGIKHPYQSFDVSFTHRNKTVNYHSASNLITPDIRLAIEKLRPATIIVFSLHRTSLKGTGKTETLTYRIIRLPASVWIKAFIKHGKRIFQINKASGTNV